MRAEHVTAAHSLALPGPTGGRNNRCLCAPEKETEVWSACVHARMGRVEPPGFELKLPSPRVQLPALMGPWFCPESLHSEGTLGRGSAALQVQSTQGPGPGPPRRDWAEQSQPGALVARAVPLVHRRGSGCPHPASAGQRGWMHSAAYTGTLAEHAFEVVVAF